MTFSEIQHRVLELILQRDASTSEHLALSKRLEEHEVPPYCRTIKVAFLSNFTIQGLPEVFKTRAVFHNLWAETYLAPYNQYAQEVLDPNSGLHAFHPDVVYMIIDSADSDEAQVQELADILQKRGMTVAMHWGRDLNNAFSDYWNTKYKDLGDFRLAPDAFPAFTDLLLGKAVAVSGATKKCLVLDLDNTLWQGIVGEDGAAHVVPNAKLQEHILSLYNQGAILAINSKNNPDDALAVIEKHPAMLLRKKHFAAMRVNWQDKVFNIRELANELSLGVESFVFVDDDLYNLNAVHAMFPQVATITPELLEAYRGFDSLYRTAEDARRGQMYAEEFSRKQLQSSLSSVDDFLRKLNLELTITSASEEVIPRIAQLTQKTNQFNMTTRRYTEEDIRGFLDNKWNIWAIKAKDRFGDYGIIGAVLVEPNGNAWRMDNFLLSCRVLGRGVEAAVMNAILKAAQQSGVEKIKGEFIPTDKNKPAEVFYKQINFDVRQEIKPAQFITIHYAQ